MPASDVPSERHVRLDLFNTTAFRLSVGYMLLVMLAVAGDPGQRLSAHREPDHR